MVVLTIWGVYLAVITRKVEENFNESRYIGLAIYNGALCLALMASVNFTVSVPENAESRIVDILLGFCTGYVVIFTLVVLYVHRFYLVFRGHGAFQSATWSGISTDSPTNSPDNSVTSKRGGLSMTSIAPPRWNFQRGSEDELELEHSGYARLDNLPPPFSKRVDGTGSVRKAPA